MKINEDIKKDTIEAKKRIKAEKNKLSPVFIITLIFGLVFTTVMLLGGLIFPASVKWIYQSMNFFKFWDLASIEGVPDAAIILRVASILIVLMTLSNTIRFVIYVSTPYVKRKALMSLLSSFVKYLAAVIVIFAVLGALGVDGVTLLASAGIISIIVGLGVQPLIEDVIAGIFIVFEKLFDVGDIIVIDDFRGTVTEIGIRTTQLVDTGGNVKVINNSDIRTLINMTNNLSVAVSAVQIEYSADIRVVEAVIKSEIKDLNSTIPNCIGDVIYLGVSELGESGVELKFIAKCKEENRFQVGRDLNRAIKIMFDKHNINIPFKQVVFHDSQKEPLPEITGVAEIEEEKPIKKTQPEDEYGRIIEKVMSWEYCNVSKLQKEFALSFTSAAKVIGQLQQDGIVSSTDSSSKGYKVTHHDN
ncbi:MAG: mechanosensitive ion channel family protein [Bacilli bacterium]|nr:mechanosensitive ion channel family protein [Bacilli bacterium]